MGTKVISEWSRRLVVWVREDAAALEGRQGGRERWADVRDF